MTTINLNKSKFLTQILKDITVGFAALNGFDPLIKNIIKNINLILIEPTQVPAEGLLQVLNRGKEVAQSYDLKPTESVSQGNPETFLPSLFFNAINETEHLMQMERYSPNKLSSLLIKIDHFCKLAEE